MKGVIGLASAVVASASLIGACGDASGGGNTGGNGGGAATGGGIGVGGGGGGITDSGSGGGFQGCAADEYTGELLPLDMYVMLDVSASMTTDNRWGQVTTAFKNFVALPNLTQLGMGIAFFPTKPAVPPPTGGCGSDLDCGAYGPCMPVFNQCNGSFAPNDSCVAGDYETPVVPIADFPGVSAAITAAINNAKPTGDSTPMAPALEGAIKYAKGWKAAHPERLVAVVLATDGEPTNCNPNRVETVAAWAAEGQKSGILTFVIGVGQLSTLDLIASNGGTNKAIIVSSTNATKEFMDALDAIRGAVGCVYKIPVPQGEDKADFGKVNVTFTPSGGAEEIYPQVAGAAACLGQKGWYYDNPSSPTQIILCPGACDQVENTPNGGSTKVVLGCTTIVR
ncbi:MAG: VWA domain-containing protein [Polyangiaceae bacterium]|nr:VWA domain-containing protein [Polyangiaceae bacterium]